MSDAEARDEISGILREVAWHTMPPGDAAKVIEDAQQERSEYLAQALDDLYKPEGVGLWWQSWLKADTAGRERLERNIIAAADGVFA